MKSIKRNLLPKSINRYFDIFMLIFLSVFPMFVTRYRISGMSSCLVLAIFAISMDLLWGYTGIMSMGQAVFFGLGSYFAAITFQVQSGVPEFMKNNGLTEIPVFLRPFQNACLGYILAIIIPVILAVILGKFLLNNKVKGIFLAIITMSLSYLMETLFNNIQKYTGGSNGIAGIRTLELFGNRLDISSMYYFNLAILVIIFVICMILGRTRFGKSLDGIRQNENRMLFLGYDVQKYKIVIFGISAGVAALSGILYTHTVGNFNASNLGMTMSTSVVIWVAIGGKGNLTGAVFGAILLGWLERISADTIGDTWQLFVGVVLLLVVLFMPKGFIGKLIDVQQKYREKRMTAGGGKYE